MKIWLAVFIGGGIGSALRFAISRLVLLAPQSIFPWATLISNVLASAILAVVVLRLEHALQEDPLLKAFLAIGLCGGLSTFSTFSYENFILLRAGFAPFAIANMVLSIALCFFVFQLVARSS